VDFSGSDVVVLHFMERGKYHFCAFTPHTLPSFQLESTSCAKGGAGDSIPALMGDSELNRLRRDILRGNFDPVSPFFTKSGSFWTNDTDNSVTTGANGGRSPAHRFDTGEYRSLALVPIAGDGEKTEKIGLLELRSRQPGFFRPGEMDFYEGIAAILSAALAHRHAHVELHERVKELTCLYGIAQVVESQATTMDSMLRRIVALLPPAWLYPEIAVARIVIDGRTYATPGFQEGKHKQTADVVANGERCGVIEVVYLEERAELDEGPFLEEERHLIDAVARALSLIVERRQAEEAKLSLQDQLLHADRLATIGQLASGVAHELNEPLGNILGFAQLAQKSSGLPAQAVKDIDQVVAASLHAREVIKKLLIFARQMPPAKTQVDLNKIVDESLYFLESRCAKHGIKLSREFAPNLPVITADPTQLQQVLVNLVVNSIQAMPRGGRLTVTTRAGDDHILLVVEDTGIGMTEEVRDKLFTPFFTTKDIGQGTGLGLPVVHGIVTSHGGSIQVESELGHGARFTIKLPIREPQENEESQYG
jgi:signal transduction histidine kinase